MKRMLIILGLVAGLLPPLANAQESVRFGKFGEVMLYYHSSQPSRVILLLSDRSGWDVASAELARGLALSDALVTGIDYQHYSTQLAAKTGGCTYPAGDLEALSQFVQKKLQLNTYILPILVGRGAGATLAYATIAQSPANTFRAGIGINFCPTDTLKRPACRGYGLKSVPSPDKQGFRLEPNARLLTSWIALSGTRNAACDASLARAFVARAPEAHWVQVTESGNKQADDRVWLSELERSLATLQPQTDTTSSTDASLAGLPVVEVRAKSNGSDTLVVIISGDGGWAGIDRDLADSLSTQGYSIVGLNSLQYFWKRRTPESAAHDLQRIVTHYLAAWHKQKVILIGYSRGADVLPFMANRLSPDLLARTRLVALLGPETNVEFEFHVQDWLSSRDSHTSLPVLPEVEKLRGVPMLCIGGDDESDSLCRKLDPKLATTVILKGGHHFGGDYANLSRIILKAARE
jgi:type IV secretory pathway VirJ component